MHHSPCAGESTRLNVAVMLYLFHRYTSLSSMAKFSVDHRNGATGFASIFSSYHIVSYIIEGWGWDFLLQNDISLMIISVDTIFENRVIYLFPIYIPIDLQINKYLGKG